MTWVPLNHHGNWVLPDSETIKLILLCFAKPKSNLTVSKGLLELTVSTAAKSKFGSLAFSPFHSASSCDPILCCPPHEFADNRVQRTCTWMVVTSLSSWRCPACRLQFFNLTIYCDCCSQKEKDSHWKPLCGCLTVTWTCSGRNCLVYSSSNLYTATKNSIVS